MFLHLKRGFLYGAIFSNYYTMTYSHALLIPTKSSKSRNLVGHEQKFKDPLSSTCQVRSERRVSYLESEVLGAILTGVTFLVTGIFCFHLAKPLMPMLCVSEKLAWLFIYTKLLYRCSILYTTSGRHFFKMPVAKRLAASLIIWIGDMLFCCVLMAQNPSEVPSPKRCFVIFMNRDSRVSAIWFRI